MFAAVALLGCNKEDVPVSPQEQHAITFGTVDTRAGLADLQDNGFGVWAFINNDEAQNYLLMENQYVEYDNGSWVYSPAKYWIENTIFSFVGVYPYAENSPYFSADTTNAAVKLTVSNTPSDVDFLMATYAVDTNEEYSTIVPLQFQHLLTSVGLKIWRDGAKHQNDQMRIKKVTLSNIRKAGTLSSGSDSWEYTNDRLTIVKENDEILNANEIGAAVTNDDGSFVTGGEAATLIQMMLLPQSIDDKNSVSLRIEYEIKRNNAVDWEYAELEASIPNSTWLASNRYTYNVVLSSVTDITVYYILTKVDQWGTPQVGGTVIIK